MEVATARPNLRALPGRTGLALGYRLMVPDPMGDAQQTAFGGYLRHLLGVTKKSPLSTLTDYCARVLGLRHLNHWRSLTLAQAEAVMLAAEAEFGARRRTA